MRKTTAILALSLCVAVPLTSGVSLRDAGPSSAACGRDGALRLDDVVAGLNAVECGRIGESIDLGNSVSVLVPAAGDFVGVAVDTRDGTSQVYVVQTAIDGTVTATLQYQDRTMIDPELAERVMDRSVANVEIEFAADTGEALPLAYSRCTDNSSSVTGYKWYASGTISVWVNGTDRRPSNISAAVFSSIASTILNRWKIGADGCSLSGSPVGLNLANAGSTTRDANITNGSTTCGTRDNYNVVDWGDLPGVVGGSTCWWGSGLQTLEFDTRLDSSNQTWTTTTAGCSGALYLAAAMMHEVGHGVGLHHATEHGGSDLTMSPTLAQCNASAQYLGLGDFNQLLSLY